MTDIANNHSRTKTSLWMQAIRPFSFTASILPILIGAMAALAFYNGPKDWFLFPFVLLGGVFLHIGGNLMSEYFDFKSKVDRKETFGSSRILVDDLMTPLDILKGGFLTLAFGVGLGLVIMYFKGLVILWLGLIGLAGAIFYGAKPFNLKYIALGDLVIFLSFGPPMVFGSYYSLTGDFNPAIFYIAIPISFLVVAILHANNTRDIRDDSSAKVKTLAIILGTKGSIYGYHLLVLGAYVATIIMVGMSILPVWTLLTLITLPGAISNIKLMNKAQKDTPEEIANLDQRTAQHHMMFGLLFSIGLLLKAIF
jgi:1,4-dihydroxy-2-naphthoate octaprenyltransferase